MQQTAIPAVCLLFGVQHYVCRRLNSPANTVSTVGGKAGARCLKGIREIDSRWHECHEDIYANRNKIKAYVSYYAK